MFSRKQNSFSGGDTLDNRRDILDEKIYWRRLYLLDV